MTRVWRTLTIATVLLTALPGCRIFKGKSDTDKQNENRDPLLGRYIPKTDLPVPGKDAAGRKDPLLTQPTNNSKWTAADKDTFRNTEATSIAGLTSRLNVENSGMSLGDKRPEAKPVPRSGTPLKRDPAAVVPVEGIERYADDFKKLKARVEQPIRDANGDYTLGATVKVNENGAQRRFEGRGPNLDAAAKELLEQIRTQN